MVMDWVWLEGLAYIFWELYNVAKTYYEAQINDVCGNPRFSSEWKEIENIIYELYVLEENLGHGYKSFERFVLQNPSEGLKTVRRGIKIVRRLQRIITIETIGILNDLRDSTPY